MPLSLLVLLLTSIGFVYMREDRSLLNNLREIQPFLEEIDKIAFIDPRSLEVLNYISSYKNQTNLEEYPADLTTIKDAYIVINKEMIRNLREADLNKIFPAEINNPPKTWIIIKEIGKNNKNKIVVYYIP